MLPRTRTLVIGIGNIDRGDDGIGCCLVEQLEATHPDLANYMIVRQLLPEHVELLNDQAVVLFIDASATKTVGSFEIVPVAPLPELAMLGHAFSPGQLLSLQQELYGRSPPAWLLEIGVARMCHGEALSVQLEAVRELLVQRVIDFLQSEKKEASCA